MIPEHRVATPCFDCLVEMTPVVKVTSITVKNLSGYLGACIVAVKTGLLPLVSIEFYEQPLCSPMPTHTLSM